MKNLKTRYSGIRSARELNEAIKFIEVDLYVTRSSFMNFMTGASLLRSVISFLRNKHK